MRTCLLSLFLALVGCSEPAQNPLTTPSAGTNAGETTTVDPVSPNAAPAVPSAPVPDPCAELRAETHTILQELLVACANDEDCACYPAIIDCGGVRDNATAQRLRDVNERRIAGDCGYRDLRGNGFNCAPWECVPRCSAGVCGRGMN